MLSANFHVKSLHGGGKHWVLTLHLVVVVVGG